MSQHEQSRHEPSASARTVASDQAAAEAVVAHHAQLAQTLAEHVERLLAAVERGSDPDAERARLDLLRWLSADLVPHAKAEEETLYPAAAANPRGAMLITGMLDEHRAILGLVAEIDQPVSPLRAAAAARALGAVFAVHLAKENELVLPLLVESDDVSIAGLLEGMHALLGEHAHGAHETPAGTGGGGCGGNGQCGCGGDAGRSDAEAAILTIDPRLDVRAIPHNRRHAHVLSALDSVPPGGALVLVAAHAPRPLLAEVESRFGGQFAVDWLQSGPDVWQVRLHRTPAMA